MRADLLAPEFDERISLRDAFRAMEAFVEAYLARGDGAVSEFFDFYISTAPEGLAAQSGAATDFLAAYAAIRASHA